MPPELDEMESDDDDADSGGGGSTDIIGGFDGEEDADAAAEASMETGDVDLGLDGDDDIVAGFDGVEEGDDEDDSSESSSSGGGGSSGKGDVSVENAIESGLAEAAAAGLEGAERERVSGEMKKIASKFRVGYFGEQVAEKYLKRDIEDIPPEYGLVAALIGFAAIAIYKRPDGEERVQHAISVVQEKFSGEDEPAPPQEPPQEPQQPPRQPRDAGVAEQAGARSAATRRSQSGQAEATPAQDVAEAGVPENVEPAPEPEPTQEDTNE